MNAFNYENTAYPIRDSMVRAFRASWRYIAQPGNWWTGAERVAIAAATREALDCALCRERKAALSPYSLEGVHHCSDASNGLSDKVRDAVHRIATDAARLTEQWVHGALDNEFTDGHWVEAVSVIVTLFSIDSQHAALGLPLEPLPPPEPGEPSGYLPPKAAIDAAWVPMLTPDTLTEPEADIFGGAPMTGNVIRAMSLVPDAVRQLNAQSSVQYLAIKDVMSFEKSGELSLTRPQIELIAARTSAINDCFY